MNIFLIINITQIYPVIDINSFFFLRLIIISIGSINTRGMAITKYLDIYLIIAISNVDP